VEEVISKSNRNKRRMHYGKQMRLFIQNTKIDRGRIEAALRAGSIVRFVRVTCAERTESLTFSQAHVILFISGITSSEGPSATAIKDEKISRRVSKPEVVFCSKIRALLYVILNLRGPSEQ
jgi:hypothetical protein